jgi:hypothetical protein
VYSDKILVFNTRIGGTESACSRKQLESNMEDASITVMLLGRFGVVVTLKELYLGGVWFESWPRCWLSALRFVIVPSLLPGRGIVP